MIGAVHKFQVLFIALTITLHIYAQTNERICEICECSIGERSLRLDCGNRNQKKNLQQWPTLFENRINSSDDNLEINYNDNNMLWLNTFPSTQNKVSLSMRRSKITYLEYAPFRDVKNLKYLDLGYNKITAETLKADLFRGPSNTEQYEPIELEVLNLEYNLIHSLPKRIFEHTPKLKNLYLNGNPMNVIDSVTILAISSLPNLEILDLSNIGVSKVPNDTFRNSKKLYQLNLSDNQLKTVPEALGYIASSLEVLRINNNSIEELLDNSFLGLSRLETLEVGEMESLKRVKSGAFMQLQNLKMLHLCHNKNLKYLSHEAFRELKEKWPIKELYLNDNNLRTLSGDLADWESLISLNLNDNPWDCNCEFSQNIHTKGISKILMKGLTPICMTPMEQSGRKITDLDADTICLEENAANRRKKRRKSSLIKRPKSIFMSLVFVITVVVIGGLIGFGIAQLRKRLKKVNVSSTVRYTNIR